MTILAELDAVVYISHGIEDLLFIVVATIVVRLVLMYLFLLQRF